MARIEFDRLTREALARRLAEHLRDELQIEVDPVDGLRLLDLLSDTLGPHYYDQGLHDAQAIIKDRADSIVEALYAIEKPIRT